MDVFLTMCACGDNQETAPLSNGNVFLPHNNRHTGEPCPGLDRGYRITPPEEVTVVCLAGDCNAQNRQILTTDYWNESEQRNYFHRVLVPGVLPVYFLECGHSVVYYTGDAS